MRISKRICHFCNHWTNLDCPNPEELKNLCPEDIHSFMRKPNYFFVSVEAFALDVYLPIELIL